MLQDDPARVAIEFMNKLYEPTQGRCLWRNLWWG